MMSVTSSKGRLFVKAVLFVLCVTLCVMAGVLGVVLLLALGAFIGGWYAAQVVRDWWRAHRPPRQLELPFNPDRPFVSYMAPPTYRARARRRF